MAPNEGGGDDAPLARGECTGPEDADNWFEADAALIARPCELLRETVERSAVKKMAHIVGRDVEYVMPVAFGVDELERSGPRPTHALELQARDRGGTLGSAPRS